MTVKILGGSFLLAAGPFWPVPAQAAVDDFRQGVGAVVAAVLVAGLFTVVLGVVRHRRAHAQAKHFHSSLMVELTWTLIPFLILFALAWPAAQAIFG